MSPRTQTPAPLDDASYWRRLMASVHPDKDEGDAELFIFLQALREHVLACRCAPSYAREAPYRTRPEPERPARVPYDPELGEPETFRRLTMHALEVGQEHGLPYAWVLHVLADGPIDAASGRDELRMRRGASYKQLSYIAHLAGMSRSERYRWYQIGEQIPLSEAHAHYLIGRLKERRAA